MGTLESNGFYVNVSSATARSKIVRIVDAVNVKANTIDVRAARRELVFIALAAPAQELRPATTWGLNLVVQVSAFLENHL